jgi:methylmalonyl-CoA mutase C-terminal domain/subunit
MRGMPVQSIKVLIGMLGVDRHEVGAIAVTRMLRDAGMEVVYLGVFNMPAGIVKTSMEEDVDVIGVSCHSWEYLHYMPELLELLKKNRLEIPVVVGGSVITPGDRKKLEEMGVAAAFGPSSKKEEIIETIRQIAQRKG